MCQQVAPTDIDVKKGKKKKEKKSIILYAAMAMDKKAGRLDRRELQ